MDLEIRDLRVMVTAGASGIGLAIARAFAREGAKVHVCDVDAQALRALAKSDPALTTSPCDVSNREQVKTFFDEGLAALGGGLDCLVNNAAIPKRTRVTDLTPVDVAHVMDVDFHSPVRMSLAVLPRMVERGSGTIVFVSSMGGRIPIGNEAAYCAAKFAMCGWAEAMYLDLAGTGVTTKLVLPGPIATEIWDQPDNEDALIDVEKVPAADCAAGIANALEHDGFEYYVPPEFPGGIDAKQLAVGKHAHCDDYLRGMADFTKALRDEAG